MALDGLPNGDWLVTVEDGRRTCRRVIDPKPGMEMLAACVHLSDWLVDALSEVSRSKPSETRRPLTAKERKAFKAYCDVLGTEAVLWLERPSLVEIAERAVAKVREHNLESRTPAGEYLT